jgi:cold shock CspA family protein
MNESDWERFHKLLKDNNLWAKPIQESRHCLLCAISTALYFTDRHRDAVKEKIVAHFMSWMVKERHALLDDMPNSARELFVKQPELPRFEDLTLQIAAELFQTRVELFYVSPRGLSTKLFFKKNTRKIKIVRDTNWVYMAAFRQPFKEKAAIAKSLIYEIVNSALNEERSETCEKMFPIELFNVTSRPKNHAFNDTEFNNDLHDISQSQLNATLRSFSSMGSSTYKMFSFKWSRNGNMNHDEGKSCSRKNKIDSLFDFNTKGPLPNPPLVRDGKERSETLATGLSSENEPRTDSQLHQSDVFEVIESTAREVLSPKNPMQLTGLSSQVTYDLETLTRAVEGNQLNSIFGFVDYSQLLTDNSPVTEKPEKESQPKKVRKTKLKATVESFIPDRSLETILNPPQFAEFSSLQRTPPPSSISKNEVFMQNLSIIQTKPLSDSRTSKEALPCNDRTVFQKPQKDISAISRQPQFHAEEPPLPTPDSLPPLPAKTKPTPQLPSLELDDQLADAAKNERDEVLEEEPRTGVLKFFDEKNGYGFMTAKDDSGHFDIFVYRKDLLKAKIKMDKIRQVKKGAVLTFSFQICHYVGRHNASRKAKNIKMFSEKDSESIPDSFDVQ